MRSLSEFYQDDDIGKIKVISCQNSGVEEEPYTQGVENHITRNTEENLESPSKFRLHLKATEEEDAVQKRRFISPLKKERRIAEPKYFDFEDFHKSLSRVSSVKDYEEPRLSTNHLEKEARPRKNTKTGNHKSFAKISCNEVNSSDQAPRDSECKSPSHCSPKPSATDLNSVVSDNNRTELSQRDNNNSRKKKGKKLETSMTSLKTFSHYFVGGNVENFVVRYNSYQRKKKISDKFIS